MIKLFNFFAFIVFVFFIYGVIIGSTRIIISAIIDLLLFAAIMYIEITDKDK